MASQRNHHHDHHINLYIRCIEKKNNLHKFCIKLEKTYNNRSILNMVTKLRTIIMNQKRNWPLKLLKT